MDHLLYTPLTRIGRPEQLLKIVIDELHLRFSSDPIPPSILKASDFVDMFPGYSFGMKDYVFLSPSFIQAVFPYLSPIGYLIQVKSF